MFPKLGIDLGTTNTLVFARGRGIVLNEPSVVAISKSDNSVLAVGSEAKDMIGKTPEDIIAYNPLTEGVIADPRTTEIMLRYYIRKALKSANPLKPEVMISVPAGITSTERRAVVEASLQAGARNVYIVKEPILAAIGAGIPIQEPGGHMIIDIGGGTTDVAVISLGGIVASTSIKCAGNRLDEAILQHIKRKHDLAIGNKTAEEIKIKIGSAQFVKKHEELSMEIKGSNLITNLPHSETMTTNKVVKAIETELTEIIKSIKDVLQDTPPELASDIMDHGITMTGGTAQLRNLSDHVFEQTGVKAHLAADPLFCVAGGTGVALDHIETYKKSVIGK